MPELELLLPPEAASPVDEELEDPSEEPSAVVVDEDELASALLLALPPMDIAPVEPRSSGGTH